MTTRPRVVLLLMTLTLLGCTSAVPPTPTTTARPVICPEAIDPGRAPQPLKGFDARTGLAPTQAPTSAVLCDYSGGTAGTTIPLASSEAINAGLPRLASDLQLAHGSQSEHSCPYQAPENAVVTTLLLGYPSGTLTLTLEERCAMSLTNGAYQADGWTSIRTYLKDHRWTGISSVDADCQGDWNRHLTPGQQLPADPVSVRVCRPTGGSQLLDDQGRRRVITALEQATTVDPATFEKCAWRFQVSPAYAYTLVLGYSDGPQVRLLVQQTCSTAEAPAGGWVQDTLTVNEPGVAQAIAASR